VQGASPDGTSCTVILATVYVILERRNHELAQRPSHIDSVLKLHPLPSPTPPRPARAPNTQVPAPLSVGLFVQFRQLSNTASLPFT